MTKHILANITWKCQLRCSYCWVRKHINHVPKLTCAEVRPLEDWIAATRRDKPEIMDIGGGEPLSVPWCLDWIRAFPDIKWGLSTNGLNFPRIDELAECKLKQVISINLSYHPEAGQQYAWYNRNWKEQVMKLVNAGYHVIPNLEDHGRNLEWGKWAIDWLKAMGLHMVVSPLCGGRPELAQPQPVALTCKAGTNFMTIAPDGRAWPCLSALNSYAWNETSIGNWLDNTIYLSSKPTECKLFCVEYFIQASEHEAGDFWDIQAHPVEGAK
jgi:organic radical activating enzyme